MFYFHGNVVKKDTAIAAEWFLKCAETGEDRCQHAIGGLYAEGDGVPKDSSKAIKWLEKSAEQNHKEAIAMLTFMYADVKNIPQDFTKAEMQTWTKSHKTNQTFRLSNSSWVQ